MPRPRFGLATGASASCLILLLAAMPAAVAAQTTPPASPALPQGDDLTLADGAGNVLIGLTVRPAQPGPNTILVHVTAQALPIMLLGPWAGSVSSAC